MLSRVKRLYFEGGLHRDHLVAILHAAADHVEELVVLELGYSDDWIGEAPSVETPNLVLMKLKEINLYDMDFGSLSIVAPNVTSVCFVGGSLMDWTLLDSCRAQIRRLQLFSNKEVDERLSQELFNMPQLEILVVEFCDKLQGASLAALWNLVMTQTSSKEDASLQDVLPVLKEIKIIRDDNLSPDVIIKFLEMRSRLGLSPIEIMQIHLGKDYSNEELSALDQLKHTMPGFSHTLSEDDNDYVLDWEDY